VLSSLNVTNVNPTENLNVDNSRSLEKKERAYIISFGYDVFQVLESAIKFVRPHLKLMRSFYINLEEVIFF